MALLFSLVICTDRIFFVLYGKKQEHCYEVFSKHVLLRQLLHRVSAMEKASRRAFVCKLAKGNLWARISYLLGN